MIRDVREARKNYWDSAAAETEGGASAGSVHTAGDSSRPE
jgi:hypothetical protein